MTVLAFVEMTDDVIRATAWRVRVPGGWIGPDLRTVAEPEDAMLLDGHDAATHLALHVAESHRGAVVEPVPPKDAHARTP